LRNGGFDEGKGKPEAINPALVRSLPAAGRQSPLSIKFCILFKKDVPARHEGL